MLSDDEARRRLRELQRRRDEAEALYDRFGKAQFDTAAARLDAEIAEIPTHIRQEYEVELKLALLTRAVEDYVVARAAQFLLDVDDLWAAVQSMLERRDAPETPAEKPVVALLDELRPLPATDAQIKAAVLAGATLASYRDPAAFRQQQQRAARFKPPTDYRRNLQRQVAEFVRKVAQEGAVRAGLPPLNLSGDLIALVHTWQRQTPDEARGGTYWSRYHRQAILSQMAVLRKLGLSDAEIDRLLAEGYDQGRR